MRTFTHIDAHTITEACHALKEWNGGAKLTAGGTDLLLSLKGDILPDYPEALINVKAIPDIDFIKEDHNGLKIGALARLSDVAASSIVSSGYGVLAEAAFSVASPQIRNTATIGGNLCQDTRCWYYRYPRQIGGPLQCLRKGSGPCLAIKGDNRYHAIMEGKKCFAVCPSDTAVALEALDAEIVIAGPEGERAVTPSQFYNPLGNALGPNEMVRQIDIPKKTAAVRQTFLKYTIRKPIDFAIVSVAAVITAEKDVCTDARIVLGAVAPGPVRATSAEKMLIGEPITEDLAEKAAETALATAKPLGKNAYKVDIARTLVKRAIMNRN